MTGVSVCVCVCLCVCVWMNARELGRARTHIPARTHQTCFRALVSRLHIWLTAIFFNLFWFYSYRTLVSEHLFHRTHISLTALTLTLFLFFSCIWLTGNLSQSHIFLVVVFVCNRDPYFFLSNGSLRHMFMKSKFFTSYVNEEGLKKQLYHK